MPSTDLVRKILRLPEEMREVVLQLTEEVEARLDQVVSKTDLGKEQQAVGRLEQSMAQLAENMNRLAEAQARTEQRVDELAQAQAKTEKCVDRLAQRVDELTQDVRQLSRTVGAIATDLGISLEELGSELLPSYLMDKCGIQLGSLSSDHVAIEGGRHHEFDLVGVGTKGATKVYVVGEAKSRMSPSELQRFIGLRKRVIPPAEAELVPLIFVRRLSLSVAKEAEENGIITVSALSF